jgi:hypothetical protein
MMTSMMAKWLWGTAVFELMLTAMFLVLGILIPVVRFGFLLTAAILFLTGIGLVLWAKAVSRQVAETNRLIQTGMDATASILSLRQTGMYVNNQPQVEMELQIDAPRHGSYKATKKQIVPLILLGRLSSGLPLAVKVDPADRNKFAIDWEGQPSGMIPAPGLAPVGWDALRAEESPVATAAPPSHAVAAADKARILATGVSGKGTVLESVFANEMDGENQPVYTLTFQIEVPGRPPVHGRAKTGVPLERIAKLQPGDSVALKVDPNNPAAMAIDWDATG